MSNPEAKAKADLSVLVKKGFDNISISVQDTTQTTQLADERNHVFTVEIRAKKQRSNIKKNYSFVWYNVPKDSDEPEQIPGRVIKNMVFELVHEKLLDNYLISIGDRSVSYDDINLSDSKIQLINKSASQITPLKKIIEYINSLLFPKGHIIRITAVQPQQKVIVANGKSSEFTLQFESPGDAINSILIELGKNEFVKHYTGYEVKTPDGRLVENVNPNTDQVIIERRN